MHARTLRYHANVSRQFHDSSRRFGESIRKPIANSSHPGEIGALDVFVHTFTLYGRSDVCCFVVMMFLDKRLSKALWEQSKTDQ